MGAARIGTVHSICGNLLKSFAYEMGLSPELEIIDEVQAKELFTEAFLEAPSAEETERLHQLTRKFGIEYKKVNLDIEEICNKVRQNNIESKKLDEFANLSKDQLDIFLSADTVDGLYEQLKNSLLDYQASYREAPDTTKKTDKVHKTVHRMARRAYMNFFHLE
jgi:ATP-dependent helicase/nuclease subunit A